MSQIQQNAKVVLTEENMEHSTKMSWADYQSDTICVGCENHLDNDDEHRDELGNYYEYCGVNPDTLEEEQQLIHDSTLSEVVSNNDDPPSTPRSPRDRAKEQLNRSQISKEESDDELDLPPTVEILQRLPIHVKNALEGKNNEGYKAIEDAIASMYRGFRIYIRFCGFVPEYFIISIVSEDEKRFPRGLYDTIQNLISDRIRSNSRRNTRTFRQPRRNKRDIYYPQDHQKNTQTNKTERLTQEVEIDQQKIAWCVGKGRSNLKRICEAAMNKFQNESVYIKAPNRDEKTSVFVLHAIKQDTLDFLTEELYKSADSCPPKVS